MDFQLTSEQHDLVDRTRDYAQRGNGTSALMTLRVGEHEAQRRARARTVGSAAGN